MPTRRRALIFAMPVVVLLAIAVRLLWLQPPSTITRENAAKIKEGMTLSEVEAILGGAARDESTGPVIREEPPFWDENGRRVGTWTLDFRPHLEWHSDLAEVWVHFDPNGRATDCTHFTTHRAEEGPLDMIRRWLRL